MSELPHGADEPAQGDKKCHDSSQPPNCQPSLNCKSQTIAVMMRMEETERAQIDF